jgi:hypothetical protein
MAITRAQQAKQMLRNGGMSLQEAKDMAPKGEFLAYINNKEADMLKKAGGSGIMTEAGIPSFVEYGGSSGFEGAKSTGSVQGDVDRGKATSREVARDRSREEAQRRADLKNITNRIEQEKIEERLEKFRDLGSKTRQFQNYLSRFSPVTMFASKFGPLNTRDFFTDKVLGSRNYRDLTKEQFSNLTPEEQEDIFDSYMESRMSGATDAYGNPIDRGEGGGDAMDEIIPVDTTFAQAPSTTEQGITAVDDTDKRFLAFRADGGPIGGEYDFESARQMYGLGKLVKKVTRTVKKIAKSDLGKAALIGAAAFGVPGTSIGGLFGRATFGGQATGLFGTQGIAQALQLGKMKAGNLLFGLPGDMGGRVAGTGLLSKIPGGGVTAAIAGTSLLAGLLTPEQEEEAQQLADQTGFSIEEARNSILAAARDNYKMDFRARGFRAEGGIMRAGYQEGSKEPVAKKTMPLLDMGGKEMDLREEGGFVPIGRMEKADDVPARLSKNEFVFTADAVRNAGDGDVDKGAEVMYNMMKNLEAGGDVSEESQGMDGARKMFQTSQRLEEVL